MNFDEVTINITKERKDFIEQLLFENEGYTESEMGLFETSSEVHYFVTQYNWNDGLNPLKWLVNSELCDKGTALYVYWSFDVLYLLDPSDEMTAEINKQAKSLILELQNKYLSGFFRKNEIKYDPIEDGQIGKVDVYKIKKGIYKIPIEMTMANIVT